MTLILLYPFSLTNKEPSNVGKSFNRGDESKVIAKPPATGGKIFTFFLQNKSIFRLF